MSHHRPLDAFHFPNLTSAYTIARLHQSMVVLKSTIRSMGEPKGPGMWGNAAMQMKMMHTHTATQMTLVGQLIALNAWGQSPPILHSMMYV